MKLALVHDYLSQDGGAEHVLRVMQEMWPASPTFVLFYDSTRANPAFLDKPIKSSFLHYVPLIKEKYQWFLPLMPKAIEALDLSDFDVVISSSSSFAKGIITKPATLHISYCHTPTRYLWGDTHHYIEELPHNRLIKSIVPLFLTNLRLWDRLAAERPHKMVANSRAVQERIRRYYNRESDVIYPPVEVAKFYISPKQDNYFLAGGRLVGYKRFDLIVQAFNKLRLPLKIFGIGPKFDELRRAAKSNIEFLGRINEGAKKELYSKCLAFIHPQEEDFGLTAVEAMASGRPVIAWPRGGAQETVVSGETGVFLDEQSWEELAGQIINFRPENFDPARIREHVQKFDVGRFKKELHEYVDRGWQEFYFHKNMKTQEHENKFLF